MEELVAQNRVQDLFNRASSLSAKGRRAEAIAYLESAVKLAPNFGEAYRLLGMTVANGGVGDDLAVAQRHLARAAVLMPENADVHRDYGWALGHSSRSEEAERAYRRAIELNPDYAQAMFELGSILIEEDRLEEATALIERSGELRPKWRFVFELLDELHQERGSKRRHEKLARYPKSSDDFADPDAIIKKFILPDLPAIPRVLGPTTRVFTMGSCFAVNIAKSLERFGMPVESVNYPEEINSTYANRYFMEWVRNGNKSPITQPFADTFKAGYGATVAKSVKAAEIVILSLGVAPCFFNRENGDFVVTLGQRMQLSLRNDHYEFRTTTVAENVDNLRRIVESLRSFNPASHIVITISPVPLKATFERGSAIVADCISKSTLRVAAHEFSKLDYERVYYWPSFEMVRWLAGHEMRVFGNDDDSAFHVGEALVDTIIDNFVETFGTPGLQMVKDA